jgi:SAM-dependent methyltransferase
MVVAERDGKTGQALRTVQCCTCGTGRIDPLPTPAQLHAWYTHHYRQDYKQAVRPALRHVLRAGRNALDRWQWLQEATEKLGEPLPPAACTLDIGASSGEFVFLMRQRGFNATGIEPHAGYAAHARESLGLTVENGSLHDRLPQAADGQFGLVTMFHVFEHLVDPLKTLQLIRRKVSHDGYLLIEVPNANRFCAPSYMFFRAHTLYFTAHSLRQALQTAGWKIVAQNPANSDNLLILAQPAPEATTAATWWNDGTLLAAQQRRTWPAYLAAQVLNGRWWFKLARQQQERHTAARFSAPDALLDALYAPGSALAQPPHTEPHRYRLGLAGTGGLGAALGLYSAIDC